MTEYKFKAECPSDVWNFLQAVQSEAEAHNGRLIQLSHTPLRGCYSLPWDVWQGDPEGDYMTDCEVTFLSTLTLAELLDIVRNGGDHVIAETLRPVALYTGERAATV